MKRILLLLITLHSSLIILFSQAPQKFNYQAVVRDDAGTISDQLVSIRISILQGSVDGTVVYSETHSPTTNSYGLITLEIGNGTLESGDFASIDWGADEYFLKVELDPSGGTTYSEAGTVQLLSVPYALNAETVNELKKLDIVGDVNAPIDSALFEVKRSDGQTVFAVYNEGVRVYVDDSNPKGTKGGFAIGGISPVTKGLTNEYFRVTPDSIRAYVKDDGIKGTKGGFAIGGIRPLKGSEEEYLRVTPDSVRVYINDEGTKGTKGGFAIGGFSPLKGLTGDYMNVSGKAEAEIIDPSDARILWYPNKEAFLTGKVLIESPDSIGINSMATGFESKAIGDYSQALGYQAIAREDYSTAIGYQAVANDTNSFAFGQWAKALNDESYAFGRGAIAEGFRSFAFGSAGIDSAGIETGVAHAIGDYSFAIGQGSTTYGFGSIAMGLADTASGGYSVALGYKTSTSRYSCLAMGNGSKASGLYSSAIGFHTTASGTYSTAVGQYTTASNARSTAMGFSTTASGPWSTALGNYTEASGMFSTAMGAYTTASGDLSTTTGHSTIAKSYNSFVIGRYNDTLTTSSPYYWEFTDPLFIIGNGTTETNRSNAMTVLKNGSVGIGTSTPEYKLDIELGSLGYTRGSEVIWQRLYGYSPHQDQLKIFHRRYIANGAWENAEIRIQKTVDATDMGYVSFKANYLELGVGTGAVMTISSSSNIGIGTTNPQGTLDVNGSIYQRGSELHADYVFEKEYNLESIEDHSVYMWENKHLPAVPKAIKDENGNDIVEWGARSRGVLEELEKAHVYIDQLNTALKEQQDIIEELIQEIEKLKNQ